MATALHNLRIADFSRVLASADGGAVRPTRSPIRLSRTPATYRSPPVATLAPADTSSQPGTTR